MNDAERALVELARTQRQVFTRNQAIDVGLSPSEIYRRRKSGLFVPYGPHTMHFAGSTLDFPGKLLAGLLDLGPGALVSGRSAAALHGLDGFDEGPLDFLVPRSMRGRRAVGTVSSTACIEALDWVTVDGLDVTSGTRTVVELVGRVDARELGNALDSAAAAELADAVRRDVSLDRWARDAPSRSSSFPRTARRSSEPPTPNCQCHRRRRRSVNQSGNVALSAIFRDWFEGWCKRHLVGRAGGC